jgi:uncharacterized protein (TIGR02246 family)
MDTHQPEEVAADEAAIRQMIMAIQDGWNAYDARAFAGPFADDADYVVVNGARLKGRQAIDEGHAAIFSTIYRESRNAADVQNIRFLRPDVAVVHVAWTLTVHPGEEPQRAMNSMVMTKEDGRWSIAAFHNTPIAPGGR